MIGLMLACHLIGWGGEHHLITEVALDRLPEKQQAFLAPERAAMVRVYCTFPDQNWGNSGQWGGGDGDPAAEWLPDNRREWSISFYEGWDPVLGQGRRYNHAPPDSYDAVPHFYELARQAFADGSYEDGARYLGCLLHHLEDAGSFPHMQPFHRGIKTPSWDTIRALDYQPRKLDTSPEALSGRVHELVDECAAALDALLRPEGHDLAWAVNACRQELMPAEVVAVADRLRRDRSADWLRTNEVACLATARACADVTFTLLSELPLTPPDHEPPPARTNLVHNPSLEDLAGDGWPEGWVAVRHDRADRLGKVEPYRRGNHWTPHVKDGRQSLLLLWAPEAGLEWRQIWRHAIRVAPGERYRLTAWGEAAGQGGEAKLLARVAGADYLDLPGAESEPLEPGQGWQQRQVEVTIPDGGRWLRLAVRSTLRDGAAWFDQFSLERL